MRAATSGSLGDGNGKPVDDYARERFANDVDPFPECRGREEHRVLRRAEPIEELRTRQLTLQPQRIRKPLAQQLVDFVQPRVRGEQHECAPARAFETLLDDRASLAPQNRGSSD